MRKNLVFVCAALMSLCGMTLTSCSDDNDIYGTIGGGTLVATGEVKDITYSNVVVMGKLNFTKLESGHNIGVVYMPADADEKYDYKLKLTCDNKDAESRAVSNSMAKGRFDLKLPSLRPGTKYYYRTYVAIGSNRNYTGVNSFETADPSGLITVNTGTATDVKAFEAKLVGSANIGTLARTDEDEDQTFGFLLSSTAGPLTEDTKGCQIYYVTRSNGKMEEQLSGLEPGTTYYYRSFFSWNGKFYYGDTKSFKTTELKVVTADATEVTAFSMQLNATLDFAKLGMSYVTGGFVYSKSNKTTSTLQLDVNGNEYRTIYVEGDKYSISLSSLTPNTTYYCRAFLRLTVNGEYVYVYDTSIKSFKTENLTVSTEAASNITSWAATLNGKLEYSKFDGKLLRAGFVYSSSYSTASTLVTGSSSYVTDVSKSVYADEYSYSISGLMSNKKYYYRAYAQYRDYNTGNTVTIYGDVNSFDTPKPSYASISVSTSGSYKWTQSTDGTWTSGNSYVKGSTSTMTVTITHKAGESIEFDWNVSSKEYYDYLECRLNGSTVVSKSGYNSGTYGYTFTSAGTSTLVCSYSKSYSGSSGSDRATIKFKQ